VVVLMVLDEGMVEMMVAKGVSLLALLEAAGIKKRRKKCKGEEETKRGVDIYIGEGNYIIIPYLMNETCFHSRLRFPYNNAASKTCCWRWLLEKEEKSNY